MSLPKHRSRRSKPTSLTRRSTTMSASPDVPRLSRGTVLAALSRAFDLAEGRRPGHAQRVAYVGVYLASELGLDAASIEDVFFGCLLHDVGMAGCHPGPRVETARGTSVISGAARATDVLPASRPAAGPM